MNRVLNALAAAEAESPASSKIFAPDAAASVEPVANDATRSPIYYKLMRGEEHATDWLRLQCHVPNGFERLDVRVFQRDVAKGCIDPDRFGTDEARDWVGVEARVDGGEGDGERQWRSLRLPAFMAHLASPLALFEPEVDEATITPLYADGIAWWDESHFKIRLGKGGILR